MFATVVWAVSSPAAADPTQAAAPLPPWFPSADGRCDEDEIDALTRAGQKKQASGTALLVIGSSLAALGAGLLIGSAVGDGGHDQHQPATYALLDSRGDAPAHATDAHVNLSVLTNAAVTAIFLGLGLASPGAHMYVDGRDDIAAAQRERLRLRRLWSIAPGGRSSTGRWWPALQ
jgi:hypothetical protein